MRTPFKRLCLLGAIALLSALFFALSPLSSSAKPSYASSLDPYNTLHLQTGQTTGWTNVRNAPTMSGTRVATYAPGTSVTIYATTPGQAVSGNINTWDRVSSLSSGPLYIYSPLVVLASSSASSTGGSLLSAPGKVIVVSLAQQWLYAYQNGRNVFSAAVMTGRPSLPTPTGTYHVFAKLSPTTFYSPWPAGSPYWYPPTHINYALEWRAGGFFLHDSWWHSVYGPGSNGWHYDPIYGWQWGSHGCVAMPLSAAAWLFNWTPLGTTVVIRP